MGIYDSIVSAGQAAVSGDALWDQPNPQSPGVIRPTLAPQGGGYGGAPAAGYGGAPSGGYSTGGFAGPSGTKTDISDTPFAWMLQIPDVAAVLNEWQSGGHTDDWLKGHIMQTEWFKTTSETARNWEQLASQDPATALQQRDAKAAEVSAMASQLGVEIPGDMLAAIADSAMRYGWNAQQLQQNIISNYRYAGEQSRGMAAQVRLKYEDIASQYAIPLADQTMGQWVQSSISGEQNEASFTQYMRTQAKSMFPSIAKQIDEGMTVRQYFDPYVQIAAKELEINPNSVDVMNPKWSKALNQIDPKTGDRVPMSLSDWQTEIRTNGIYGYDRTMGAKTAAADLATQLLQKFGQVA